MTNTGKRRGRPPSFDRLAALRAATSLFWRHGYEGTSIAMLTESMGVTPPTLYAAFGSKEALYRETLAHYAGPERAEAPATREDISVYAIVERYLREAAARFTDPNTPKGCMVAVGSLHCGGDNRTVVEAAATLRNDGLRRFIGQLDNAKRRGDLPIGTDTDALARFYAAVVQGMAVQAIDGADAARLDALADVALAAWPGRSRLDGAGRASDERDTHPPLTGTEREPP